MTRRVTFEDALDQAIDRLLGGEELEDVLAQFPKHEQQLRVLLQPATTIAPREAYEPPSARLMEAHYRIRTAANTMRRNRVRPVEAERRESRWSRRAWLAPASLPALLLALGVLSAGAATAAVAVGSGVPSQIAEQVERVTPEWTHALIPTERRDPPAAAPSSEPPPPGPAGSSPSGNEMPDVPPLLALAVEGTVVDVRGSVFDLVSSARIYVVQTDAKTTIEGDIAPGATVTVEGMLSANDQLHATRVLVVAGPAPGATTGQDTGTGPATRPESTPTPPAGEPTASSSPTQAGGARTPGRPEPTRTPGPPATPPGLSDQGGTSDGAAGE